MRVTLIAVRYQEPWETLDRLVRSFVFACDHANVEPEVFIWNNGEESSRPSTPLTYSVLSSGVNLYHSGGCNAAADQATGELLVFANPDMILGRASIAALVQAVAGDGAAIAEGRQVPLDHPKQFDPESGNTSWASGALFAVKAETFLELGGFDERALPMYCNDVDLSWRARAAGGSVKYIPGAWGWHGKVLKADGAVAQSEYEPLHAPLGFLALAYKWRRMDVVDRLLNVLAKEPDVARRRCIEAFEAMRDEGVIVQVDAHVSSIADIQGFTIGGRRF